MKMRDLYALLLSTLLFSCDDSTTGIGDSTIAGGDSIPAGSAIYTATTRSILADSVYARTSTAYLGKYTDPQFGEFTADFIAQFNCGDDFEFPETLQEVTGITLRLYYSTHFGDSLNAMRLQVDSLDTIIPEGEMSTFYTSVDPKQYYNPSAQPLARKAFSAKGISAEDSTYTYSDGYGLTQSYTSYWQNIKLPISLGQMMYDKYVENRNNYKNSEQFIKNVLKGFYVSCTHGDGTILYIDDMQLILNFNYLTESSSGKVDSLAYGGTVFAATKEVIQANRFQNSDRLKELAEDPTCTYLKTPAGIFTEVTLPIEEIAESHLRDTLNAVSITFTRYNEKSDSKYQMGVPDYLLMVRKSDMYTFFEKNKLYDNQTSFLAQYIASGTSGNTYSFNNIAALVTYCINEKKSGKSDEDWNKVVLIPVKVDMDASSNITGVKSNLDMESASLKGGEKDLIKMQVLYTTF
ncbi:MAG: DUF4270 domain-containing protein [Bacteroides sp.]|nr:DUF4270 domain-containing protein [Bacteroides sp.]